MISDEAFTEAMERAVAKRGAEWRYPSILENREYHPFGAPIYSTPQGEAACLIGAAMKEAGLPLPHWSNAASATGVLGGLVSPLVAKAARIAQRHQDANKPWGECLALFHTAYRMIRDGAQTWHMEALYFNCVLAMKEEAALDAMVGVPEALAKAGEAVAALGEAVKTWAGIPVVTYTYPEVTVAKGGITFNPTCTPSWLDEPVFMPKQSEHALIA
jgi:hypothetical protein